MSSKNLSIKQRLLKAKSAPTKAVIVSEWAQGWCAEHERLLDDLQHAGRAHDWVAVAWVRSQLQESHSKRFAALPGVLAHLLDYEADSPSPSDSQAS